MPPERRTSIAVTRFASSQACRPTPGRPPCALASSSASRPAPSPCTTRTSKESETVFRRGIEIDNRAVMIVVKRLDGRRAHRPGSDHDHSHPGSIPAQGSAAAGSNALSSSRSDARPSAPPDPGGPRRPGAEAKPPPSDPRPRRPCQTPPPVRWFARYLNAWPGSSWDSGPRVEQHHCVHFGLILR